MAAASRDTSHAKLYVRDRTADAPELIPGHKWEYTGDRLIRLLPQGELFKWAQAVFAVLSEGAARSPGE